MGTRWTWLLTLLFALASQAPALAWHDAGHAAVAAVAWKDLSGQEDQKTREKIVALLRQHQDYQRFWQPKVDDSGVEEGEFLLMHAALWPDDIRPPIDKRKPKHPSSFFHMPSWHFKDRAYIPPGQPKRTLEKGGDDAQQALSRAREALAPESTANTVSRSVALCWLAHLTGDVHQPLHATALLSDDFPGGDHGGNLFLIKHSQDNLHSYWDGLFDANHDEAAWSKLAGKIVADAKLARSVLQAEIGDPFQTEKWLDESYHLAIENAYTFKSPQGQQITLVPGIQGKSDKPARPLPDGYDTNAHVIGQKRIALAGYRLADMLRRLFPRTDQPSGRR